MDDTDALVWERVKTSMPLCDCGQRLEPGGFEEIGPLLVCTSCAFISSVSWDWVDEKVAQARAATEAETAAGER